MDATGGSKPTIEGADQSWDGSRTLLIAAAAVRGSQTIDQIRRAGDDEARLFVVAPALTEGPLEHAMGAVDDAIAEAQQRLEASIAALREAGLEARGHVGDSDPLLAIEDGLREFGADSIVLVTRAGENAHWLEGDLFERAKQRFEPPIVHVEIDGAADGRVAAVHTDGPGAEPPPDVELEGQSKNFPRFSMRDLLGIVVAVIGTIAAVLIAVGCDDGETLQRTTAEAGEGTSGSCVAAQVVAGLTALINVAHVVGLVLFESVGYRGGWSRFFAMLSLVGTPVAVLAVIVLAH